MGRYKSQKFADMKRRAILDAATAEFEAKGPDNASMRAIASGAGVTTGAIYSMFEGKEDLYSALLLESLERLEVHVAEQTALAQSVEEAVTASVMAFFSYYRDRPFEVHEQPDLIGPR
ncbi:TetR/AcrR family transcriptional regulator [Lutimaribacter saemankumensis]|uniref:Regulatory protein, tetR family n=1 Tax=Lutimaribacter saemankumensis TaxID=490829 RepID=A0A1G8KR21_9RHOB|nr:TetR/AcrR family transcriptional regulator [Lutimaribacter saemankumensis]SDI45812.1 regulatory protein, tetR family [Lutimaribacter saemankumensis]